MRVFTCRDDLERAVGMDLGASDWLTITQDRVNSFAEATGDHQWIHVDPQRAADGPFGGTIAHGYLTVSLLPVLTEQVFTVQAEMAVNYGLNKLRFPHPVHVGSAVRATVKVQKVDDVGGAVQVTTESVVQIRDSEKPALVAETVGRYFL